LLKTLSIFFPFLQLEIVLVMFYTSIPLELIYHNHPVKADVIAPAVTGTLNVLKACKEAEVKRVVVVSSVSAVFNNPNWPKGKAFTEDS
jgi:nucleoside-diphosphate-sugar epimerase